MTTNRLFTLASFVALCGTSALAQQTTAPAPGAPPSTSIHTQKFVRGGAQFRGPGGPDSGPGPRVELHMGPPGMWWKNPDIVQKLTLSADQQKRMDDIFQQSRLQLIDLKANVEKQEILLEPMLSDNPPDTNKVLAQIDHVASARAELEKANARMLLGIRGVLSADQWTKLQAERQEIHQRFGPGGPGFGPGGPGPAGGFRTRGGGPSAPISMMDAPSFPPGSTLILQQGFAGPDEGLLLAEVDDLDL